MTKNELSQLYYLNREIVEQQRKLEELECKSTACGVQITGLPKVKCITGRIEKFAIEIADLRTVIDINIKKCFFELNRLTCYINNIEDSQIRILLRLRYINGLSWNQIAFHVGGNNTEDGVRKLAARFLKNNC